MNGFQIIDKIGEGAHGVVLKATKVRTGQIVALKKVALRRVEDGIPPPILREIKVFYDL
jgi:cell cycle related kinase